MAESKPHSDSPIWMSGSYKTKDLLFSRAIVREGLSILTRTTIEILSRNKAVKMEELVGQTITIHLKTPKNNERKFHGICISVENLGFREGYNHFVAEVRPWPWLMGLTRNCRIFQDMTAMDIVAQVLNDNGFSDFRDAVSEKPAKRDYCVQYRETDIAFISRLLEEEGIYYYFDQEGTSEKLVFANSVSGHKTTPESAALPYSVRDSSDRRREDHVAEWTASQSVRRGKVTLNDFDFLSPTADLKVTNAIKKGKHSYGAFEVYDYPGHYRKDTELGNTRARVRMEAEAIGHKISRGASSVRTLATGYTFSLGGHPDVPDSEEFLVRDAIHYLQVAHDFADRNMRHDLQPDGLDIPEDIGKDAYANVFSVVPKTEQFRAPLATPWPEIPGLHTATVVGKSGEEIWTDEHGRIKVQFHWDRDGKRDENSSCWVRVVTPWSGKGWGMVAIPRIGQEVVIQFEEGDPDRPICTGMLYNADTKPAFKYPDDPTQLGIRTNSSKGGGGYNELMFEDKKDAELMRVQAQKDHQFLIKNKSVVTIGQDEIDAGGHDEDGSLSEVIRNHVTRTIQEGSHYLTIQQGDEEFKIETGSQKIEIKTDKTQTITQNYTTTVEQGNMSVAVSMGKIEVEAMQSIELKVGASSIKLEPAQITIKSPMIKVQAEAMAEVKSPMTTVKGEVMLTLKGGITMIN